MNAQVADLLEDARDCTPFFSRIMLRRETTSEPVAENVETQLLSSRALRDAVAREMSRSESTHSPLALLVFKVASEVEDESRAKILFDLSRAVLANSRKSDVAGFYREGPCALHVGLLLENTEADRAWGVIAKVIKSVALRHPTSSREEAPAKPAVTCDIYGYAEEVLLADNGPESPQQLWLFDQESMAEVRSLEQEESTKKMPVVSTRLIAPSPIAEKNGRGRFSRSPVAVMVQSLLAKLEQGARAIRGHAS